MIVDGGMTVGGQFSSTPTGDTPNAIAPAGFMGPSFQG